MIADLVVTVRISWWVLLGAILWGTVAHIVSERRAAKFEQDHREFMERQHERQMAEWLALRNTPDEDE